MKNLKVKETIDGFDLFNKNINLCARRLKIWRDVSLGPPLDKIDSYIEMLKDWETTLIIHDWNGEVLQVLPNRACDSLPLSTLASNDKGRPSVTICDSNGKPVFSVKVEHADTETGWKSDEWGLYLYKTSETSGF